MNVIDTLPPTARQFLTYRLAVMGQSRLTVEEYALDLRMFFRYVKRLRSPELRKKALDDIDVSDMQLSDIRAVSREEIYEFLLYISEERDNNSAARARKLSTVKAFFKHLTHKEGKLEADPSNNIDSPALKRTLPRYLSLEESMRLLQAVESDTARVSQLRDFAIITLFLNCAMRLSELIGMNIGDISGDMRTIRILGKRNKERLVYLNDAARSALSDYLEERGRIKDSRDENAVFLSGRKQRINKSTVQKMLTRFLELAGLGDKHYSPHKLRHTSATLMYQNGADVRVLQEILGHSNLNTTQIYTHTKSELFLDAVAANPLADYEKEKKLPDSLRNKKKSKK